VGGRDAARPPEPIGSSLSYGADVARASRLMPLVQEGFAASLTEAATRFAISQALGFCNPCTTNLRLRSRRLSAMKAAARLLGLDPYEAVPTRSRVLAPQSGRSFLRCRLCIW
jgi:hypothetical protein